ncbi:MAG: hypothetical protein ACRD68_09700 [Pyrinomonadaceae bacterium]
MTPTCGATQDAAAVSQSRGHAAEVRRRLTSGDPLERRLAAEELARLADPEERLLVEGYRLQEKDTKVRLALDWALYRMGRGESLFEVVRALDSGRANQAQAYLTQIEDPASLDLFLARTKGNTQIKLLQVLAHVGNAETIPRIEPLAASPDPLVAEAAKAAARDISARLAEEPSAAPAQTRPREVRGEEQKSGDPTP